jgi:hypothetical protein
MTTQPINLPPVPDFQVEAPADVPVVAADNPVDDVQVSAPAPAPWPIVEGAEHFSLWINDPAGPLPEFVSGHHYDVRQPSQLRGLCSPCERTDEHSYRWPDGDTQRDEHRALEAAP